MSRITGIILAIAMGSFLFIPTAGSATPLNAWSISCGVDRGSIKQKKNRVTFKTSSNHCKNGSYKQRAELKTDSVSPRIKGKYLFSTRIRMKTKSDEPFDLFQIHDGRANCTPPLKVSVLPDGSIELNSGTKILTGKKCLRGRLTEEVSKRRIRRDGKEQKLEVLVDFDGKGGFKATVSLDGKRQLSGTVTPSEREDAWHSPKYYFKHGVYSRKKFKYEMKSSDMRVRKVE